MNHDGTIGIRLNNQQNSKALATVKVTVNGITLYGCRLVDGKRSVFLSMPQKPIPTIDERTGRESQKWINQARIEDPNLLEQVTDSVVSFYHEVRQRGGGYQNQGYQGGGQQQGYQNPGPQGGGYQGPQGQQGGGYQQPQGGGGQYPGDNVPF